MIGRLSSSSSAHFRQDFDPKPMVPNARRETFKPVAEYAARKKVVVHLENDNPVSEDPFFIVQVIELSKVEWADGSRKYDEWSPIPTGERLKFQSGWIDVFFTSGAELLIQGPADVRFEKELGVYSGVIGEDRVYLCPVCARKDEWVPLQHEATEKPPWRCAACNKCFPGGGVRIIRPDISSGRR